MDRVEISNFGVYYVVLNFKVFRRQVKGIFVN